MTQLLKKIGLIQCILGQHFYIETNLCGKCGIITDKAEQSTPIVINEASTI
jgi:hypothetical protein